MVNPDPGMKQAERPNADVISNRGAGPDGCAFANLHSLADSDMGSDGDTRGYSCGRRHDGGRVDAAALPEGTGSGSGSLTGSTYARNPSRPYSRVASSRT